MPDWLYIVITVFRNTLAPTRTWRGPVGWWWPSQRSSLGLEEKLCAREFQFQLNATPDHKALQKTVRRFHAKVENESFNAWCGDPLEWTTRTQYFAKGF